MVTEVITPVKRVPSSLAAVIIAVIRFLLRLWGMLMFVVTVKIRTPLEWLRIATGVETANWVIATTL